MILTEYLHLQETVLAALARLKSDIERADQDEVTELASRLRKSIDGLSRAECRDAGRSLFEESARIVREGRRLLFALKMTEKGEEFPRLHRSVVFPASRDIVAMVRSSYPRDWVYLSPKKRPRRADHSMPPVLIGTYSPPPVRRGDRVSCLYRDSECVVTGIHDGPIPWPRVRSLESSGGSGLWVNDELVRAIRTESAAAMKYWFGVCAFTVYLWRKTVGVKGKFGTPGSQKAQHKASKAGVRGIKAKTWTKAERAAKRKLALKQGRKPGPRWTLASGAWTDQQLALLGTDHDEVIAARIGRTPEAVRVRRTLRKIPKFCDRRFRT